MKEADKSYIATLFSGLSVKVLLLWGIIPSFYLALPIPIPNTKILGGVVRTRIPFAFPSDRVHLFQV